MTVLMQSVLLLLHMDIFCNHVLISYKCFRFLEFFFFFLYYYYCYSLSFKSGSINLINDFTFRIA